MHLVGHVAAIARYPVKSMQGESLERAVVEDTGVRGDRLWGVLDAETGRVLSAKRVAPLLDAAARYPEGADGQPDHERRPRIELPGGTVLDPADDPDAVDRALTEWLGRPVRLAAAHVEGSAPYEMSFNLDDPEADVFEVPPLVADRYVDLAPAHLLTTASVAAASAAYPEGRWSLARFRPTVHIATVPGVEGFVEETWVERTITAGSARFSGVMPTIRCNMPTRAQAAHDLPADKRIAGTLRDLNDNNLGLYAGVVGRGEIAVGDEVTVS